MLQDLLPYVCDMFFLLFTFLSLHLKHLNTQSEKKKLLFINMNISL